MDSFIPASLRRFRTQRRQTLDVVSGLAGMSSQHLSEIEGGKRDAQLSSIERVAAAMSLSLVLVPDELAPAVRRYVSSGGRMFTGAPGQRGDQDES